MDLTGYRHRDPIGEPDQRVGVEQIDPMCIGVARAQQGALSRLPGPPEKEGMGGLLRKRNQTLNHRFRLS